MRAHWAAAASSAPRMSGRRRSISAGTPTATFAGGFGISFAPASNVSMLPAGWPSRRLKALRACSSPMRSWGTVARVLSSCVVACVGSSSDVAPAWKRDSAIASASSWMRALSSRLADQHFGGAQRDVRARDLRGQRDQRRLVVGHRGEQAGGLRFDAAPVFAPEVQLPGGVEADLIAEEVAIKARVARHLLGQADRLPHRRTTPASGETAGRWRRRTERAPR